MFKSAEEEIGFLLYNLNLKGDLTQREIQIGQLCYHIGRLEKEAEITKNRRFFREEEERIAVQEKEKENKVRA